MAINRGVLGTQTGSMGGITASNWKGRNVYKQKVPATNSSNSPAQQMQRAKFAILAKVAGQAGAAIRKGFAVAAATVTELNVFQSRNFPLVSYANGVADIDLANLVISSGVLANVSQITVQFTPSTGRMVLTWPDNSNGGDALPTDQLNVLIILRLGDIIKGLYFDTIGTRAVGSPVTLELGPGLDGVELYKYQFFKRANSTATSPSLGGIVD